MAQSIRLGIDIGGTGIKVGVIDADNHIVGHASLPTHSERPWQQVVADIAQTAHMALQNAGVPENIHPDAGVGCPGTINARNGEVVYSNNLRWDHVPLAETLTSLLDAPVRVSNDANCAALGEVCAGAAKGCRNVVLLTLGTGVGSGFIVDGRIFEGGGPGGAEFGHTLLVENGEPCTCGRRGCLESYASATALIRQARRAAQQAPASLLAQLCAGDLSRMDGRIPFVAARRDDPAGLQVVQEYMTHLAAGIVNAVNIFRPETVLLSGGISKEGSYLTDPLQVMVNKEAYGGTASFLPVIRAAELGNTAGMIGAANLLTNS